MPGNIDGVFRMFATIDLDIVTNNRGQLGD